MPIENVPKWPNEIIDYTKNCHSTTKNAFNRTHLISPFNTLAILQSELNVWPRVCVYVCYFVYAINTRSILWIACRRYDFVTETHQHDTKVYAHKMILSPLAQGKKVHMIKAIRQTGEAFFYESYDMANISRWNANVWHLYLIWVRIESSYKNHHDGQNVVQSKQQLFFAYNIKDESMLDIFKKINHNISIDRSACNLFYLIKNLFVLTTGRCAATWMCSIYAKKMEPDQRTLLKSLN